MTTIEMPNLKIGEYIQLIPSKRTSRMHWMKFGRILFNNGTYIRIEFRRFGIIERWCIGDNSNRIESVSLTNNAYINLSMRE